MQKTVHIGIDATCWVNDRGYGRFTRSLVAALAARDTEFRYTLVFDAAPASGLPEGVGVIEAGARRAAKTASATRSPLHMMHVARTAAAARFDLYFYPALFSYYPLPARTPCVVCFHDATAERFPDLIFPSKVNFWLWRAKTALAIAQSVRAMTISQSSARDLEAILRIRPAKIDVITEGPAAAFHTRPVDRASVLARYGLPAEARTLVYVGGFNRHKNVIGLLRAMPSVVRAHPDARLVIVGDLSGRGFWDNRDELMGAAESDPALRQRIVFPGYVPDEALCDLFNAADALVFPSLWEGFGLPAVEAMACGLPVLSSNVSSLPEIVGDAGVYFDPEHDDAIAAAINEFLDTPQSWPGLKQKALARADLFTWDRAAELAEASFRKALRR